MSRILPIFLLLNILFSLGLFSQSPRLNRLGVIYINGQATGLNSKYLEFKEWCYAEHLLAKNTGPILKDGELRWLAGGFEVRETTVDGSFDPSARKRWYHHKLEKDHSYISKDAKTWYPLKIRVLSTRQKRINPLRKLIMTIELNSEIFSATYDVFDVHDNHKL